MLTCDKCGSRHVIEKHLVSKKNGKPYVVIECQAGCMAGKWKYSFFPPKAAPSRPEYRPPAQASPQLEAVPGTADILREMRDLLRDIRDRLRPRTGTVEEQEEQPPF